MILLAEWHYEPFLKGHIRIKEVDEGFSEKKKKKSAKVIFQRSASSQIERRHPVELCKDIWKFCLLK